MIILNLLFLLLLIAEMCDVTNTNYIFVIQTHDPLNRAQREELAAVGTKIISCIDDTTYLASFQSNLLQSVWDLDFITGICKYKWYNKISPTIADIISRDELVQINLVLHVGINVDCVKLQLASVAGIDPDSIIPVSNGIVQLQVSSNVIPQLAMIEEVCTVMLADRPHLLA